MQPLFANASKWIEADFIYPEQAQWEIAPSSWRFVSLQQETERQEFNHTFNLVQSNILKPKNNNNIFLPDPLTKKKKRK